MKIEKIKEIIENLDIENPSEKDIEAIEEAVTLLDTGLIRVAELINEEWVVNEWVKNAILHYFVIKKLKKIETGEIEYLDKLEPKKNYEELKIRVVPPGVVRYGAFCEPGVVVMPGFVNIGAYVGSGTMVDTWATVGSCAQIGKDVHLSGGVGIGGVLEPPSAMPVIIEDGAFIGSRSIIVEGVKVEKGAVIGANVTLTASTPIIDVTGETPKEYKGVVPSNSVIIEDGAFIGSRSIIVEGVKVEKGAVIGANVTLTASTPIIDVTGETAKEYKGVVPSNAVVIPGTRPKEFPSGEFQTPCALIIGKRKDSTNKKTSLNEALRTFGVDV